MDVTVIVLKRSNIVKYGEIFSPISSCIYMDELLYRLNVPNVGCRIGNMFLGALRGLVGRALEHRSLPTEFESRRRHI